jgi:PAS domain S-box-containing protein
MDRDRAEGRHELVVAAGELARRVARAPDSTALNEVLRALARGLAREPAQALQALVEAARGLSGASSAGLALADAEGARWRAAAGPLAQLAGSALEPAALAQLEPRAVEALRAPFGAPQSAHGELWLLAHEGDRALDAEDQRMLEALADFAALACETLSLHGARGESDRRFEEFMQHLPGLAWIKDLEGRYVFANGAAGEAFRRPLALLYGRTDEELFPAETAAQFRANDLAALSCESGVEAIETLEHDDGVHYSLVHKFPIPGPDGTPRLIGGMAVDVTDRMRAEQVLRESEERFREMTDSVPAIIYTTQPDGYCTFLSSAWSTFTGRPNELGLGFGWAQVLHPDDVELVRSVFTLGAQPFRLEFRMRGPAGDYRWVIGSGAPRFAASGAHLGFVGSVLDVSEEKRAERALHHSVQIYRAIGDSIDYGVWVCDPEGRNVYASQSFLRLVGLTQEQCSGYGWTTALHPEEAERTLAEWQECVRAGREWYVELRFRGSDGGDHPVLARGVPVRNERGEITAWAGIHLDISRQKQVEEELREIDRKKDEFLATLAHELRNPLAPIRNSLLVLRAGGGVGDDVARIHDMIERQLSHLIRLVDDLLEVSRITSGKVELRRERVELGEVVRAALESSMPAIDAAGHRLDLSLESEPLVLEADAVRLTQVLANLLNNAAKYTEEGGAILLSTRREGSHAVISVRDNGLGIPTAMLPRVFDLFAQVGHTLGRAQGGLGIGLALVKRLVEMHGGRVEARSNGWGTGSEFVVTLPLASPASLASTAFPPSARAPKILAPRRRFLVVDDNRDAADSLALLLEVYGAEVRVTYDGISAVAELRGWRPDVVLLDLGMPDMDGFEVAARIRKQPELAGIMLVALTGWGQPEDRRATRAAGFDLHLVKPVSPPELRELIALRRP